MTDEQPQAVQETEQQHVGGVTETVSQKANEAVEEAKTAADETGQKVGETTEGLTAKAESAAKETVDRVTPSTEETSPKKAEKRSSFGKFMDKTKEIFSPKKPKQTKEHKERLQTEEHSNVTPSTGVPAASGGDATTTATTHPEEPASADKVPSADMAATND